LPDLISIAKTLYGKFGSKEIDHETAAQFLGHSTSRSGAYREKIAALNAFGLIEGRGSVKVSEIGRKVSYPDKPEEEMDGLAEAMSKVELWKLFYEKYTAKGLDLPSDLWTDIREWTGLAPDEAKKSAEIVRKCYLDDIKYFKLAKRPEAEEVGLTAPMAPQKIDITRAIPSDVLGELTTRDYGILKIRDAGTIEIARKLLELLEAKLKEKEEQTPQI